MQQCLQPVSKFLGNVLLVSVQLVTLCLESETWFLDEADDFEPWASVFTAPAEGG